MSNTTGSAPLGVQGRSFFYRSTGFVEPKPHKTYREQVALLVDRGMLIDDEDAAIALLGRVGYYTLSGYSYPFRFKDSTGVRTGRFRPGTSLTQVEAIWEFDNRLRAAAFGPLQHVETYLRGCFIDCVRVRSQHRGVTCGFRLLKGPTECPILLMPRAGWLGC